MDTGFHKVAGESTRIVETGSKTREEKICGLHEIENYGFCQLELFTTSKSMPDAAKIVRAPFFGKWWNGDFGF